MVVWAYQCPWCDHHNPCSLFRPSFQLNQHSKTVSNKNYFILYIYIYLTINSYYYFRSISSSTRYYHKSSSVRPFLLLLSLHLSFSYHLLYDRTPIYICAFESKYPSLHTFTSFFHYLISRMQSSLAYSQVAHGPSKERP